jgi:hypothetical protein
MAALDAHQRHTSARQRPASQRAEALAIHRARNDTRGASAITWLRVPIALHADSRVRVLGHDLAAGDPPDYLAAAFAAELSGADDRA